LEHRSALIARSIDYLLLLFSFYKPTGMTSGMVDGAAVEHKQKVYKQ